MVITEVNETLKRIKRAQTAGSLFKAGGHGRTEYNGREYVRAGLKVPKEVGELWLFDKVYLEDMPRGPYMSMGLDVLFDVDLTKNLYTNKDNGGQKFTVYKFWNGEEFFYVKPSNVWMFHEVD